MNLPLLFLFACAQALFEEIARRFENDRKQRSMRRQRAKKHRLAFTSLLGGRVSRLKVMPVGLA